MGIAHVLTRHSLVVGLRGALAGAIVVLSPALALAQASTQDELPSRHVGPLHYAPRFVIRNLGFDTNVFNEPDQLEPVADFMFTAGPELTVVTPLRWMTLSTTGSVDYVYYHTFDRQRGFNTQWRGAVEVPFNRVTFFGRGSILSSRDRPSLEVDVRRRRIAHAVEAGARISPGRKLAVEVSGERGSYEFPDESDPLDMDALRLTQNRDTESVKAKLFYRVTPMTTVVVNGEARRDRFEFAPERDADVVLITPGIELNPRALVSGYAHVGVRVSKTLGDTVADRTSAYVDLGLTYNIPGDTQLTVTAIRDQVYSTSLTEPYYINNGVGARLRRPLGDKFDVIAGGNYHRYSYAPFTRVGVPVEGDRRLIGRSYLADFGYRLSRDARMGIAVVYDSRRASELGRSFTGWRGGATFSMGLQ